MFNGKPKTNSFCVGRHFHSSTVSSEGDIPRIRWNLLVANGVKWSRKKVMTVIDKTFEVEGFDKLYKNRRIGSAKADTSLTTYETKNPGGALDIGAKISSAAVSKVLRQLYLLSLCNYFLSNWFASISWKIGTDKWKLRSCIYLQHLKHL